MVFICSKFPSYTKNPLVDVTEPEISEPSATIPPLSNSTECQVLLAI